MSKSPWSLAGDASVEKSEDLVGMTFTMPRQWHTEFKMRSAQEGLKMKELLIKMFDEYKRNNP